MLNISGLDRWPRNCCHCRAGDDGWKPAVESILQFFDRPRERGTRRKRCDSQKGLERVGEGVRNSSGETGGGGATGSTRSGLRVATSEGSKGRTLRAARFRRGRSLERRACGVEDLWLPEVRGMSLWAISDALMCILIPRPPSLRISLRTWTDPSWEGTVRRSGQPVFLGPKLKGQVGDADGTRGK